LKLQKKQVALQNVWACYVDQLLTVARDIRRNGEGVTSVQWQDSAEAAEVASVTDSELATILRAFALVHSWSDVPGLCDDEVVCNIMSKRWFLFTTAGHWCVGPAAT
jgi:hypothetical protein